MPCSYIASSAWWKGGAAGDLQVLCEASSDERMNLDAYTCGKTRQSDVAADNDAIPDTLIPIASGLRSMIKKYKK